MRLAAPALLMVLAACAPPMLSPEAAAEVCQERARAAQAPTAKVTVGANSDSGAFSSLSVGISSDFVAGRDPVAVYEDCVYQRSGQPPYRPPVLR